MALAGLANGAVTTGFRYPVVAKYNNNGGTVSYSDGRDLARGVSMDVDIEVYGENNVFYANDGAAEEAKPKFKRGTVNLTVDGLFRASEDLILGSLTTESVAVGTGTGAATVSVSDNDDDQEIPYVGYGVVLRRQSAGVEFFQGLVYPKTRFNQFAPSAETQGEEIDWQTTDLSAALLRDDTPKHKWQRLTEPLATDLEAYNAVRVMLDMSVAAQVPGNGAVSA